MLPVRKECLDCFSTCRVYVKPAICLQASLDLRASFYQTLLILLIVKANIGSLHDVILTVITDFVLDISIVWWNRPFVFVF